MPGKREQGFTLLEIMVSLSIIALALTTLLTSQSQSLSLASEAKFDSMATLLAQSRIAEIETANIEDLRSESGDFGDDFPNYYWEMELNSIPLSKTEKIAEYIREIDLKIFFGREKQYQYNVRLYRFAPKGY